MKMFAVISRPCPTQTACLIKCNAHISIHISCGKSAILKWQDSSLKRSPGSDKWHTRRCTYTSTHPYIHINKSIHSHIKDNWKHTERLIQITILTAHTTIRYTPTHTHTCTDLFSITWPSPPPLNRHTNTRKSKKRSQLSSTGAKQSSEGVTKPDNLTRQSVKGWRNERRDEDRCEGNKCCVTDRHGGRGRGGVGDVGNGDGGRWPANVVWFICLSLTNSWQS